MAYIIGVALGDGNLSNPNGRATRLRITCDRKYPRIIQNIKNQLKKVFPDNKISIINRKGCVDISLYSNDLESILGWRAKDGSKIKQIVRVPDWIKKDNKYRKPCLLGLLQTDGSLYYDRGYLMINFTNAIKELSQDVKEMIEALGYKTSYRKVTYNSTVKYVVRISSRALVFKKDINLWK